MTDGVKVADKSQCSEKGAQYKKRQRFFSEADFCLCLDEKEEGDETGNAVSKKSFLN